MKRSKHLCFLFLLHVFVVRSLAENLTLNINLDKPVFVTDERFLSLTVDPTTLLTGSALSADFEKSINLAKAMAPAYIRLGGPSSSSFRFTDPNVQDNKKISVLSESDWILIHRWAKKTGLDAISCISPNDQRDEIEDTTEIISFSDHMAFNGSWQLGYECQTGCNISASDLARRTINLRKLLNEFPRYSNSLVIGPDVVDYRSEKQRQYLREYFDVAAPVLSAITWHPDFTSVTLDNEGAYIHQGELEKNKEELLKIIGPFIQQQPLWIAESKPEEYKNLYIGALILARRLGNAAKSKINVLMRQPTDLTQPSPDYWVSLLHKTLVGPKVFHANARTSDQNHVHLYSQCTKPSGKYEKGSVTIFGVNLNPEEAVVNLKGIEINTVHEYVLSPGFDAPNRMFSESVFLNNQTLSLINDTVPELHPVILNDSEGLRLELQPGGIGFWVLPDLKIKSCMEDDGTPKEHASSGFNVFQDSESAEDIKVQVTRSVQDLSTSEAEKQQKIASPATRKSILQKELRKLRKFTKKQLDEDSSSSEPEDAGNNPNNPQESQTKLQEFKNRISQIRSTPRSDKTKPKINKIITHVTSLLSKIQNTQNNLKSSNNLKNHLKSLHDFLNRVNLNEPVNGMTKKSKIFKRDLYGTVEDPVNRKWKNPPSKRSRIEDEESRDGLMIENVREIVRPSVIELENGDSDEHTFYGFFRMDPAEGFPEGDVFFATGELPNSRNSEIKDRQTGSNFPGSVFVDPEDPWVGGEDDYPFYGPSEFFPNSKILNNKDRVGSGSFAELWEAESLEPRKNVQLETQDNKSDLRKSNNYYKSPDFRGYDTFTDKQSSNRRINYANQQSFDRKIDQRPRISDHDQSSLFESLESEYNNYGRSKRDVKDLHTILDQEMVKEDDANSKDCKCRVIRRLRSCDCRTKRDDMESAESATVSELKSLNSHDMVNVEVFSELKEAPMEAVELKTGGGQNGPIGSQGVPSEPSDSASVNLGILDPVTPSAVSSSTVSPNQNGRSVKALVQGAESASFGRKSRKGRKQIANLDLEAVPSETIGVTTINFGDFNTEAPILAPSLTLISNEGDQLSTMPIQPEESKFSYQESRINEGETSNPDLEIIPVGAASVNLENYNSETPTLAPSLMLISNEGSQSFKVPIEREEITLPRQESVENGAKTINLDLQRIPSEMVVAASENLENFNSETPTIAPSLTLTSNEDDKSIRASRAPFFRKKSGQNEMEETTIASFQDPAKYNSSNREISTPSANMEALQEEAEEDSSTTLKSAILWEQDIARESEMDSSVEQTAVASTKRQVVDEQAPKLSKTTANNSLSKDSRRIRKQKQNLSNKKTKSNVSKARESQLMQRSKVLSALAKMIRGKTGDEVYKFRPKSKSRNTGGGQLKNREEEGDLKDKSRDRKKLMLQKVQERIADEMDEMDEMVDDEKRNLKRREVWEMIEDTDDFEDAMDCEKLACVLVYKPTKNDNNESYESIEKREAPETEIVRVKNVRERIFHPKNQRNYYDSTIMEHPNPYGVKTEIVELEDLYESEIDNIGTSDEDDEDDDKTYFALVENLDKPRIFRLREKERDGKRSVQILSPYSSDFYDDYAYDQPRSRPYRTNFKNPNRKEIFIIDPSEYRGGEPILKPYRGMEPISKPYRSPSKSRSNLKSKALREAIRKILRRPHKIRKTEHKREDKSANEDETETSMELDELSKNINTGELLKVLIDNLDLQSVEQLFKQLDRYNTIEEKHNFVRSIVEEMKRKGFEEDVDQGSFESMENSKGDEPVEILDSEEIMYQTEGYQDVSLEKDTRSDEDNSSVEASIVREHSAEETPVRRRRDTDNKSINDYSKWLKSLFLRRTLRKIQEAGKGNDLNLKEGAEDTFDEGSSEIFEIFKKNEQYQKIPVLGNKRSSLNDVLSVHMDENSSNTLEDEVNYQRSDGDVNLEEDKSQMLKMFPWTKKFDRFRRQTVEKEEEINTNTDMIQPSEVLQRLEESSSSKIQTPTETDDIDKSVIEKIPIVRYKKTENQKKSDVHGLPSLIQESIPSLQNVVIDGLQKAKNFTGSVERLIENLDENFNETANSGEEKDWVDSKSMGTAHNVFHNAIINVKKFFTLLGGITRILRG